MKKIISTILLSVIVTSVNAKTVSIKDRISVETTTCIAVLEEGKFQASETRLTLENATNAAINSVMSKDKQIHLKYPSIKDARDSVAVFCSERLFEVVK